VRTIVIRRPVGFRCDFSNLELDRSFEGLLQVSSAPLSAALAQISQ
jgi:hypothetical protein